MGSSSHNQKLSNKNIILSSNLLVKHCIIDICSDMNAGLAHGNHLTQKNPWYDFYIKGFFSVSENQSQTEAWTLQHKHGTSFEIMGHRNLNWFSLAAVWAVGEILTSWAWKCLIQLPTGLCLWLDSCPHLPLGHILNTLVFSWVLIHLKHKQTEGIITAKESKVQLIETQMVSTGFEDVRS